jgi:hypothetical protein
LPVSGGIKRNKSALPKGESNLRGGSEPLDEDARVGDYDRSQLEQMNLRFSSAMERERPGKPRRRA